MLMLQMAKKNRILYEFHLQQNAKKPGTVHATYLIAGMKRKETTAATHSAKKDGDDDYMQSSPFVSSSMPQPSEGTGETSVLSIALAREEDLESVIAHSLIFINC
jgi:DNA polymerase delta subunit 3